MDLNAVLETAVRIGYSAGDIVREHFGKANQIQYKGDYDIVTEADKNAEKFIVAELEKAFPDHHIVGEEGGSMGAPAEEAEYYWYIDPVDGTTNFAAGIPYFSISIAVSRGENEPLAGIVYNPNMDEMFAATKGGGATLNGEAIACSDTGELKNSVLITGYPHSHDNNGEALLLAERYLVTRVRGMRQYGSAALDLCWVAAGRFEAYWEGRLNRWDYFGGLLIAEEAGAVATDYYGERGERMFSLGEIIVSNKHLHPVLIEALRVSGESA